MEAFQFKKAIYKIEKDVMEEFNRRFKEIESDVFLTKKYDDKVVSLTGYKEKEGTRVTWDRGDKYEPSMDRFSGSEYDSKVGMYQEFVHWMQKEHDKNTVLGKVYCPYTHEVIQTVGFPTAYSLLKPSYYLGSRYGQSSSVGKIKLTDLFKYSLKNNPLNHMSKTALNLFFSYWSYDVLDKVTLKEAKDKNLLKVDAESGTLYYGYGDETWTNQLYYGPKGFFVKMKKERIYVPCPSYQTLEDDLELLDSGHSPLKSSSKLPTMDERIIQAIEFGVLDAGLTPKKENDKVIIVQRIKRWIDAIESDEDVSDAYERIKEAILNEEK